MALHSVEAGSRLPSDLPPLLILHGLFGAGNNFGSWASVLGENHAPGRRIVLATLRNHGESEHAPSMGYEEMAADVVALCDRLGIARAVLCGHSLGAKVAMHVALEHPERVERLLVLDMAPVSYTTSDGSNWGSIEQIVRAMRALDVEQLGSKRDADAALAPAVRDPGLRAFVLTNLVRSAAGQKGWRWRINLPAIEAALPSLAAWDADRFGRRYDGLALFVAGGRSRYIRSTHLPAIEAHFSAFSLTKLKNADHWVHADEPEALHLVAANFLRFRQERS